VPHKFLWFILIGLVIVLGCVSSPAPVGSADNYQEMFDPDLFNERVKLIDSMGPGTTREDLLRTLGEPQVREVGPDGGTILIYRVRCYMGPEPLSRWPRHMSATYEARFVLDSQGRVKAVQTNP